MNQRFKGFTLIELLTVVAVLGVLAAIAFPNMRDYMDKQRLVSQVRAIADMAQFARSEAIKHSTIAANAVNRKISMTVSPTSPWFVGLVNGDADCTNATTCVLTEAGSGTPSVYHLTATECTGCTMTSPGAAVRIAFDLRGLATVTPGADQLVTLNSPMGKRLSISVSRLGRISLCSPGGSVGGYGAC